MTTFLSEVVTMERKHGHYFRSVAHLSEIDIYRFLDLFGVTDQALGHAIKKLVAPGGRGAGKDFRKDVQEAIDTLTRRLEMLDEDLSGESWRKAIAPIAPTAHEPDDDDWIEHDGKTCPVQPGTYVRVKHRSGSIFEGLALNSFGIEYQNWIIGVDGNQNPHPGDIVSYRVRHGC
jgi:hypothetical protein